MPLFGRPGGQTNENARRASLTGQILDLSAPDARKLGGFFRNKIARDLGRAANDSAAGFEVGLGFLEDLRLLADQVDQPKSGPCRPPTPFLPTDGCHLGHIEQTSEHRLTDVELLAQRRYIPGTRGLIGEGSESRLVRSVSLLFALHMRGKGFHAPHQGFRIEFNLVSFHARNSCLMMAAASRNRFNCSELRFSRCAFVYK